MLVEGGADRKSIGSGQTESLTYTTRTVRRKEWAAAVVIPFAPLLDNNRVSGLGIAVCPPLLALYNKYNGPKNLRHFHGLLQWSQMLSENY